ncbi:MAG: hypothetical protein EXS15_05090 [Phycisphaerales bacterium]|nr:hypothetical protein [Phycisphaerales bacterium]
MTIRSIQSNAESLSRLCAGACVVFAMVATVRADEIGYDALVARLSGQTIPNGAGVGVSQVEAPGATALVYGPDQTLAEFAGKTFVAQSGVPVVSGHATTVAQSFYSNTNSIASGVALIYLWEVNSFISSSLRYGAGSAVPPIAPLTTAMKVYNHSWIGGFSGTVPTAGDNEVLRRADFAMNRDDTLAVVGMNNGATSTTYPMMAMGYHSLSVGIMDGGHSHGTLPTGADGAGRMKPEIVAPGAFTSFSTPVVGSVAAILFQTAATHPSLSTNTNADEPVVIRAALLAGARHRTGWTNNPASSGALRGVTTSPLDRTYGADVVNVDRSHRILTGAERNGTATSAAAVISPPAAWDFEVLPSAATRYWRIRSSATIPELSIVATWNRSQTTAIATPTVADINLTLYRVNASGGLDVLEGDAGAAFYASGNVASRSTVDNIEHIYLTGLASGEYVIEAKRIGTATTGAAFSIGWIMPALPGDLNLDGVVDGIDLAQVLSGWGGSTGGDANGDGVVDGVDLAFVLSNWG